MRKFLRGLWRIVTFPFRAVGWILTLPFRAVRGIHRFMATEPEEHSLGDVFSDLAQNEKARQLFWDQVEALRGHLLRSLLGLIVGVGIAFLYTQQMVDFLAIPVGGLQALQAIEVTESIGVFMKVALLAGIAISIPYIAFELWAFAAPGLRPRERVYGLVGIPMAAIFFIGGMAFTYYVLLPSALPFLLNFLGIKTALRPASYFSFVTGLMFWIGVAFEFPLVIYVLTAIGLVKPQPLARNWRIAVVIISIVAAAITPTVDPVNMGLVMLPMILLYFISIGLSFFAYAGRRSSDEQKPGEEEAA
ncbi:MAG: twin-arginine translocase subunit TatC [Chloroflexi bacterium]|nr:twin-arginine translocase subunit TatC [Chloroflexota bacterium]